MLLWPTNRKSHTRFRLVPTSVTLDDFERLKRHSCRNEQNFWAHRKNFDEDKPILSAAKCTPMVVISKKNIRYMRIFTGKWGWNTIHVSVYQRPNSMCLWEIIPCVLLTYRVGVHWGVACVCPSVRALTARDCTPLMPIKGSNTCAFSQLSLRVLFIVTIRPRWRWIGLMMTAVIESDYVITCMRQLCDLTGSL